MVIKTIIPIKPAKNKGVKKVERINVLLVVCKSIGEG